MAEPSPLRLHVAAFASTLLDIRGRLPSLALAADPALESTFAQGLPIALPATPADQPKVLVLQRPFYDTEDRMLGDLTHILRNGWVVVMDVDDHPDFIARQQGRPQAATDWSKFAHVHAVQTSTPALAEAFRTRNPQVRVFPNAVFDLPPFPERSGSPNVFYGAANRGPFPAQVAASLKNVIRDNPRASFVVVHDRAVFDALPTKRKTFHPTLAYEAYLEALAACDICLSPLEGAAGEAFKSDAKFLEAARGGVLTIASPTVYAETIVDGETGLIARELRDWDRQLRIALRNGDKRRAIARAAWEYVRDQRMFAQQAAERRDWYLGLWANREALTRDLLARVPALAARLKA
ncbi:MAG: glycosyltransferase [Pseudomonadota bacterium]